MSDKLLNRNIRITINLSTPAQSVANGGSQAGINLQQQNANNNLVLIGTSSGEDFTIDVSVSKIAGQTYPTADVTVFGLSHDLIAAISHVNFFPLQILYNVITVEAGYDGNYNMVFTGHIINSAPDYTNPSTPFRMQCQGLYMDAILQAPNYNPNGTVYVQDAINAIASHAQTPLTVVASGISNLKMSNPVYTGGVREQLTAIANDNNLSLQVDNNTVYVSPNNQPLNSSASVEISEDNVLIGYPQLYQGGVMVRVMYNNVIQFGQQVTIKSSVPLTAGQWYIVGMTYSLNNRYPAFEIMLQCQRYGFLYNNG